MTFAETATLAAAARARQLWLTHFSPALPNPDYFRREAEAIYPGVVDRPRAPVRHAGFAD